MSVNFTRTELEYFGAQVIKEFEKMDQDSQEETNTDDDYADE
jgi:hypothetical protein